MSDETQDKSISFNASQSHFKKYVKLKNNVLINNKSYRLQNNFQAFDQKLKI